MSEEDFGDDLAHDEDIDGNRYQSQAATNRAGGRRGCPLSLLLGFLSLTMFLLFILQMFSRI
jgi:hypothetical protein